MIVRCALVAAITCRVGAGTIPRLTLEGFLQREVGFLWDSFESMICSCECASASCQISSYATYNMTLLVHNAACTFSRACAGAWAAVAG